MDVGGAILAPSSGGGVALSFGQLVCRQMHVDLRGMQLKNKFVALTCNIKMTKVAFAVCSASRTRTESSPDYMDAHKAVSCQMELTV